MQRIILKIELIFFLIQKIVFLVRYENLSVNSCVQDYGLPYLLSLILYFECVNPDK